MAILFDKTSVAPCCILIAFLKTMLSYRLIKSAFQALLHNSMDKTILECDANSMCRFAVSDCKVKIS
jgi:hypothetical protein